MRASLKKHFGYDTFRPLQAEIIAHVLQRRDALVLMPTGGGKSLCFQLPALMFDGVTLVVSPLISLMKDQVDALQANGVPAAQLNSSLSPEEIATIEERAETGQLKLLYLAPERLALLDVRAWLKKVPLALIAIDEAHCISEWGHDFRPEYRNLRALREDFPAVPVITLTATATERVRADIIEQLGLQQHKVFQSSFNRPNLTYRVQPKRGAFPSLLALLRQHPDASAIVYCFSRRDTEKLADKLQCEGLAARPYHAGLDHDRRRQTQEQFIRDEVRVIVATIAFGMGIDKPDVRLVVHYDLPKSIAGYYQETGRAGRDNLPSQCVLFYSYGDTRKHRFFIDQLTDDAERRRAERQLQQVVAYAESLTCRRRFLLEYFGETWPQDNCRACDACLSPQRKVDVKNVVHRMLSMVNAAGSTLIGPRLAKSFLEQCSAGPVPDRRWTMPELKYLVALLVAQGLLSAADQHYPVLRLTAAGRKFLQQPQPWSIDLPMMNDQPIPAVDEQTAKHDRVLFEQLRQLRKSLADQRRVPPFVIFGDRSLQEMATYYPQSLASFGRLYGVGQRKITDFGPQFVQLIRHYTASKNIKELVRPAWRASGTVDTNIVGTTYEETKVLVKQKLSIADMAQRRGLAPTTIIGHLERLRQADPALNMDYLRPPPERLVGIGAAFEKSGGWNLAPVRAIVGEKITYDELRLARMFLRSKNFVVSEKL